MTVLANRAMLPLLVVGAVLAGCSSQARDQSAPVAATSSDSPSGRADARTGTAVDALQGAPDAPAPSSTATTVPPPADSRWADVYAADVRLAIPRTWRTLPPKKVAFDAKTKELLARNQIQLPKDPGLSYLAMSLATLSGKDKDTLNVVVTPGNTLPSPAALHQDLLKTPLLDEISVAERQTPVGKALVAQSRLVGAARPTYNQVLLVPHRGKVVVVTVTSFTQARAQSVLQILAASARPIP